MLPSPLRPSTEQLGDRPCNSPTNRAELPTPDGPAKACDDSSHVGTDDSSCAAPPLPRPHSAYEHGFHFLSNSGSGGVLPLRPSTGVAHWEWAGEEWQTPRPSCLPKPLPTPGITPLVLPSPDLQSRRLMQRRRIVEPKGREDMGGIIPEPSPNLLRLFERQEGSFARAGPPSFSSEIRLDQVGNWPFADEARIMALLQRSYRQGRSKHKREVEHKARAKKLGRSEVLSMARVRRMYQDWVDSASFADNYKAFTLSIPRRLTKKELLKLREVVYRITVRKMIRGFGHLREAFHIPSTGDKSRDLDCLKELNMYHDYTLWTSQLFYTLRSPQMRLSELEALVVLELKLRMPLDTVMAILDSQGDPGVYIPRDRLLTFDEFCILAMPGMGEVQQALKREERDRLRWEFEQKEREAKMGAVWERIKKRRLETKFDLENALFQVQPPVEAIDTRNKGVLQKILQAGAKWWTPDQRRKFEGKLKTRIVLVDIKATLYRCVMEGVSLGGLKPSEMARILQRFAAVKIQAAFRCHSRYRKYQGAMRMYRRRVALLRFTVFEILKRTLLMLSQIKKYCRRPLYRWRHWIKRRKVILERFRLAHWPFHVWWRYTITKLRARDKARFLVAVYRMYMKLRVFNALKHTAAKLQHGKRCIRPLLIQHNRGLFKEVMRCWHLYAREVRGLRVSWELSGKYMVRRRNRATLIDTFTLWRYVSYARRQSRVRSERYFRSGYMDYMVHKEKVKKRLKDEAERAKKEKRKTAVEKPKHVVVMEYLRRPLLVGLPHTAWDLERPANARVQCLVPPFPLLIECDWARGPPAVDTDLQAHSMPVFRHYVVKDRRAMAVAYLRYRRLGPIALVRLREWVVQCKKNRYAVIHASLTLERKSLNAWREALTWLKEEKQARLDRKAERLRQDQEEESLRNSGDPWYQLNELEKDMVTRRREEVRADECVLRTHRVFKYRYRLSKEVRNAIEDMEADRTEFTHASADLLYREKVRGAGADALSLEWSRNFKQNAVESLVYSLVRMQASLRHYQELNKVRKAFRGLRLLYIDAKARHMYNFFHLRRMLDICHRFHRLHNSMPRFHTLKTKYLTFRRWIAFVEFMYSVRTNGVRKEYRRRRELVQGYDKLLTGERLIGKQYGYHFLNSLLTSRRSVFVRWVYYTQLQATARFMSHHVRNIYRLRFLGRMLLAWRHGISPSRSYAHRRAEPLSFGEKRSLADLGTARAHVLTVLKRSLVRNIRYRNTKHVFSLKKAVCLGPGFKATMRAFEDEIEQRIIVERSLLFAAFELRGCMSYVDSAEPQQLGRSKEDERKQKDKDIGNTYSSRDLPAAHLIQGIHVYTYKSRGVVGLSVTVAPGEFPEKTERYPAVGRVDGRCETFRLQPRERLVQIEVMAGIVIEQIRFKTSDGRLSKWMGKPINHALAVRSCLAVPNDPTICVVGFHGAMDSLRILTIGLKVRRVQQEHLFTYFWVDGKSVYRQAPVEPALAVTAEAPGPESSPRDEPDDTTTGTGDSSGIEHQVGVTTLTSGSSVMARTNTGAPGLGSPEQEYVVMLAMRHADLLELKERVVRLSKRMWESTNLPKDLAPLRKPHVVLGLVRWLFEALSRGLPPLMPERTRGQETIERALRMEREAALLPPKIDELEDTALQMEDAPRPWLTKGLVSASDRDKEAKYQEQIAGVRLEAEKIRKKADEILAESQRLMEEGQRLVPRLNMEPRVREYYRRLMNLVRTQSELHKVFSPEAFHKFVYFGKSESSKTRPAPDDSKLHKVLEKALRKHVSKPAAETADLGTKRLTASLKATIK